MNMENFCTFADGREAQLVSYIYGELTSEERAHFDRHLNACLACRTELGALEDVRADLAAWSTPEVVGDIAVRTAAPAPVVPLPTGKSVWRPWRDIPMWAQTAAAILVLGVAAGFANLEITYGNGGFSVRTGWNRSVTQTAAQAPAAVAGAAAPSRAEFDALAAEVRASAAARPQAQTVAADGALDEALVRRVKGLVQESEQRQQRELALRLAEVVREGQVQRQVDLEKIDRNLGLMQRNVSMESMRTQQYFNSLAQRVSQPVVP